MVRICALASGSNGNAYYIEHNGEAVLVDAGISRRQLIKRLKDRGLSVLRIKAVFISHEHSDHIKGFRVICDMQKIPGYISRQTMDSTRKMYLPDKVSVFAPGDTVTVGNIKVHCFAKSHDAADPCSFRVEAGGVSIGVMTDIGSPCDNVKSHLAQCHALFLESNYDEAMLETGPYPYYLKQRVASDRGHLSNKQAVALVEECANGKLQTIFLSHISADNNRPDIALKEFSSLSSRYRILPTDRHAASEIVDIVL